jgi:hypothetical protein
MAEVYFHPRSLEFSQTAISLWLSKPDQRPAPHGEVSDVKRKGHVYHLGRLKAEMQSSWPIEVQKMINVRGVGMPDALFVVWE